RVAPRRAGVRLEPAGARLGYPQDARVVRRSPIPARGGRHPVTDFLDGLAAQAERIPDASALGAVGARALTYWLLVRAVGRVARDLGEAGFAPRDRMLFSIRPSVPSMLLLFGTIAAGGPIVSVDPGVGPALFDARVRPVRPAWAATASLL